MARIISIEFDEDEVPEFITVRMSVRAALFAAVQCGKLSHTAANEAVGQAWGGEASHELYDVFNNGLANRFWDGGTPEAVIALGQQDDKAGR